MGHELVAGYDRMGASDGKPVWHGLNEELPADSTPEYAVERLMPWLVGEHVVYRMLPDGTFRPVNGFKLLRREDHGAHDDNVNFDIVSQGYAVIQNHELPEIIKSVLGETGARVVTAGTIKVGRRVWILCKAPETGLIKGDAVDKYFLLHNSHDRSGSMDLLLTPTRVVCYNTLTLALANASEDGLRLKHTSGLRERLGMIQTLLTASHNNWRRFLDAMEELADQKVSPDFVQAFVEYVFPASDKRSGRALNARKRFLEIMANPKGGRTVAVQQTAFGVYNAATEYAQYDRTTRVTGTDKENRTDRDEAEARMSSVIWGSGADFRENVYNILTDPEISQRYGATKADAAKAFGDLVAASN